MRLLGIDYGSKKTGIALSDEEGNFAFPHSVIRGTPALPAGRLGVKEVLGQIEKICLDNNVAKIILGKSLNFKRQPNPIMKEIETFKTKLKDKINIPVEYQDETLTTSQARRIDDNENIDAQAAALILQGYIDKSR